MPETPPSPPPIPTPEDEGGFDLENWIKTELYRQYDEQVEMLRDFGILEHFPEEDMVGILGIDGEKYALPPKEAIAEAIRQDPERYRTKIEQGFKVLNLVPFAKPLIQLIEVMKEQILTHKKEDKLLDTSGEPLDLDPDDPFYVWEQFLEADTNGELVYYPKQFDKTDHQGQAKQEILDDNRESPFSGWNIQLLEDLPDLPREGQGETINSRSQIEANKTPEEYLEKLKELAEQGMVPEDWIIYFLQYLKQHNQVIDDWQGKGSACYLTGAYHPSSDFVPFADWYRGGRQADLGRGDPGGRDGDVGLRPAVKI